MQHPFLVPIVTPFRSDETVDHAALARLTRAVLVSGADGVYAGGSSAECFLLTDEERKATLETVVRAADGAYVVAHVGAIGTKRTLEFARHAKAVGASALSSVPPFYFAYPFSNVLEYYADLANVGLPVIVYSIPDRTRAMTVGEYVQLLSIEGVAGLKFTDHDYYLMQQVIAATGAEVYSGKDECFVSALAAGASGAIGTTFNFMLEKFKRIETLFRTGKPNEALAVQTSANAIIALCTENLFGTVKYLIRKRHGIDCGDPRKPLPTLDEALRQRLDDCFDREISK